ncbi:ABC-three component system middle component 6 [Thioalkalivibrio sp. HK1]|uniref:ABC-three component system middle component 6 n=1 Tax=Thioalkalivibrio sp. HK1 TaxID=1469245 RepID=UPI0005703144|nr:ABC-three component system middle component 6 [Thioalkalivibrio sp. HK1]
MTILPTKYIPLDFSILGVASIIVQEIQPNDTVSTLWDRLSTDERVRTFNRFAAALTLLFAVRALEFDGGVLCLTSLGKKEK